MNFWKMNGAGNDFIILNNIEEKLPQSAFPELARKLCERHLSIGADGFMVVEKATEDGDFKMLFFNGDGSVGEMCGNGARCISRYGFETGLSSEVQRIETTAGLVIGERVDKRNYRVRLNDPTLILLDKEALIDEKKVPYHYIELGDPGLPHAVVPIEGLRQVKEEELFELGRKLRYYQAFPKGANVNFYEIIGTDHVYLRTWERGVEGFTYACGTGTASTVLALTKKGLVSGKKVCVDMVGGTLTIDVTENDPIDLYLTGPTNIVAKGEVFDEELPQMKEEK
ncbi:diaminopimelate epimerase [Guggenheimella bovis]